MNHLKISTRLTLLTGGLCLLLAAGGGMGLYGLNQSHHATRTIYDDRVVPMGQLRDVYARQMVNQQLVLTSLIDPQPQAVARRMAELEANAAAITRTWEVYMGTALTAEERALGDRFIGARKVFLQTALLPIKQALLGGDQEQARRLALTVMPETYAAASATLEALTKLQIDIAQREYEGATASYARLQATIGGAIVFALVLAGLFGWRLTRSLTRALGAEPAEVGAAADAVAAGDLARPITLRPGDSTSVMAAMQRMNESLAQTVTAVRQNAESVASASAQIAAGNNDLSSRTEEQASALEETAASMEELSSTVGLNADNARQANQLALGASEVAARGGAVVVQVVQTMKGINESSKKIADIISVIDGIAFQTNILALNAAVEAARAGDQGRGFAVVATEVRSLAHRSADAAKEIKTLITASVERVQEGTALVDQAGSTMQEVVTAIGRVTTIMNEITAATIEQSAGVGQVNEAITQMDQTTQQNAALVEQSAAAAESLKAQAVQLVEAVALFKLASKAAAPQLAAADSPETPARMAAPAWNGPDRRGENRARNVVRPRFTAAPAVRSMPAQTQTQTQAQARATGTDGGWASF